MPVLSTLRHRARVSAIALAVTALCAVHTVTTQAPAAAGGVSAASSALPFELVRGGGSGLVFAHYWTPLPLSLDNRDPSVDYYARNYLVPEGEKGKHAAYGGYLRDRPLTRPVDPEPDWRLRDMRTEVQQALAGGLDGFTLDVIQLEGGSDPRLWENAVLMLRAAQQVDPDFKIMIMPDMGGSMARHDVATFAAGMARLAAYPSAYRLEDGRLVVSPFKAEAHPASWWAQFQQEMDSVHGIEVALVPTFVAHEKEHLASFAPISYGMSIWGSRNPAWNDPSLTYPTSPRGRAAAVKELGMRWMQPVSVQDERPRSGLFDEAENTRNLRSTWQLARDTGAELVQIPTWNDYTEGTHLAPSVKHGWAYLDINAYYAQWYRTGQAPTIVRDTVYLTHRTQPHDAAPSYPQSTTMTLRGGSPARDTVEALTFLTAPGTVTVTVGDTTRTCTVQAGVDTCTVPLQTGTVRAVVTRDDQPVTAVTSPHTVTDTPYVQDLQYVAASSGRTPDPLHDRPAPADGGDEPAATGRRPPVLSPSSLASAG